MAGFAVEPSRHAQIHMRELIEATTQSFLKGHHVAASGPYTCTTPLSRTRGSGAFIWGYVYLRLRKAAEPFFAR